MSIVLPLITAGRGSSKTAMIFRNFEFLQRKKKDFGGRQRLKNAIHSEINKITCLMLLCHTWIEKSETYRRNIGLEPSGATRGAAGGGFQKMAENIGIYRYFYRLFWKFPDISYQSSPRTGYKICPIFFKKKKKKT